MGIKFTNNAEGTLTAGVGSSDTTDMILTAGDGLLFPTIVSGAGDYFYATLVDSSGNREIVKVTEHQSGTDVFQAYVREQDDTSARAFSIGDKVQLRLPKVILVEYRDDIATNASDLADYESSNDSAIADLEAFDAAAAVLAAPSGITLYIYNPAGEIPAGWSAKSGPADCLLAIAGGSQGYNVAGENLAGSWTPTGHVHTTPSHYHSGLNHTHTMPTHTHTGPSHTHPGNAHTHSGPSHSHSFSDTSSASTSNANGTASGSGTLFARSNHTHAISGTTGSGGTGTTGSGGSGASGSGGTGNTGSKDPGDTNAKSGSDNTSTQAAGNTGSSKEPSTDRPYAAVGLLIERD
jgi:hypothetical protein